jgi:hypothetical protein
MNLFFDFEFTGLHAGTTPISLGIVAENFGFFYAEFTDYNETQIEREKDGGEFIKTNVLDNLILEKQNLKENDFYEYYKGNDLFAMKVRGNKSFIAEKLKKWLFSFNTQLEMWGDCLHYDWVLFLDLFGSAFDLPECVYYIPFDICTLFKIKNIDPDINREEFVKEYIKTYKEADDFSNKHNSLHDADIIMYCYNKLIK